MNAHTTSKAKSGTHDCGCGCGGRCGCESRCCDLECLVRPNFYCGQLLNDTDLDALVEWTRKRFSLTRYRDGWGIVCGLDVSCSGPDDARSCCGTEGGDGPFVYVKPGYAVDCCGNDLVVCEPLKVDLSSVCADEDDPCAPKKTRASTSTNTSTTTTRIGRIARGTWADCIGAGELVMADLFLRYAEDLRHGERPLAGGRCGDERTCEYPRVLEHPCVYAKLVESSTATKAEDPWAEEEQKRALATITAAVDGGVRSIREYLRLHPINHLCFITELVCCFADKRKDVGTGTADEQKTLEAELKDMSAELKQWLYYDWFQQWLICGCPSCKPDDGVPIARVYLFRAEKTKEKPASCSVLMIDTGDDYRRALSRDECAKPDNVFAAVRGVYGVTADTAEHTLSGRGFTVTTVDAAAAPASPLVVNPAIVAGAPAGVRLHVATDPFGIKRVIGFERTP